MINGFKETGYMKTSSGFFDKMLRVPFGTLIFCLVIDMYMMYNYTISFMKSRRKVIRVIKKEETK